MAVDRGYVEKKYASDVKRGYAGVLTKISLDKDGQTNITDICESTNVRTSLTISRANATPTTSTAWAPF